MVLLLAHVEFAAQDRLDPLGLRGIEEVHRAVDIAVIGDRNGLLTDGFHARDQFFDIAGAIQQ